MKKVLAVAFFAAFGLMSCKKDYTCTCTTTTSGISASASTTINATKGDAEDACNAGDQTVDFGGTTSTTACEIQ